MAEETEYIVLNHAASRYDQIKEKNCLGKLLTSSDRKDILFVGEGNFTFTLAFAALRTFLKLNLSKEVAGQLESLQDEVWKGITSTRYDPVGNDSFFARVGEELVACKPVPVLSEVKLACIAECTEASFPKYLKHTIQCIVHLPEPPETCFQYGVDACAIPPALLPQGGVIWFQCPWSGKDSTGQLIRDFLVKTAAKVKGGTHLCVGITKQFPYTKSYELEELLGPKLAAEDNSTDVLKSCSFLGVDVRLTNQILRFGYRHEGCRDIHNLILKDHVTLVFLRKYSGTSV